MGSRGEVYSDTALALLEKHGARVERETKIAHIPKETVEHCLAAAPRSFILGARNPAHNFPMPSPVTRYALDGTAAFAQDFHTGQRRKYVIEMVDRYDDALGFTSMARTTGFTGAIIARMIARGDLKVKGMFMSEQAVFGPLFDMLVSELATAGVRFTLTTEKVEPLG